MADGSDDRTSVLDIELPEVVDRNPYTSPTTHLAKKAGVDDWEEVAGRRVSKTLMVNRIRQAVDEWRQNDYTGISGTSLRLIQYWFEEDHHQKTGAFRYYYCQREAVETLIYLYEVRGFRDCF